MNWVRWFLGVLHNVVVLFLEREGACLMSMSQSTLLGISKEQSVRPHHLGVLWQVLREFQHRGSVLDVFPALIGFCIAL